MNRPCHITLVIAALFGLFSRAYAQQTPRVTPSGIGYLEHLPPDYLTNPTKDYPVLIFLHGAGEVGSGTPADLEKVKANGPPKLIEQGHNMCFTINGVQECFIVISPQLPSVMGGWWPSIQRDFFDYILNGNRQYRIDRNRVYLTGLSMGGQGVYIGLGETSDIFAAGAVVAGFNNGNGCIISERKIAVWGFHGTADGTIPYATGLNEFSKIGNCTTPIPTAELKWTSYPGVGHNAWTNAYTTDHSVQTPNVYEWLLSKSKSISNISPVANAGTDKVITLPTNTLTLSGSGTDADGTIFFYSWTKVSGPNATLTNANTATLSLSNLTAGSYLFRLTVTDNSSATSYDDVNVIVNQPPIANAGADKFITLPSSTLDLAGNGNDPDGYVNAYQWTKISGPNVILTNANTSLVSLNGLLAGTYVFRLAVTDNSLATAYDNVTVTVSPMNLPPVVNAGADATITLPATSLILSGSSNDPEGASLVNQWTQISGPVATLSNVNTTSLSLSNLVAGSYVFRLTSADLLFATSYDEVNVFVNQPPVANAGTDKLITLPTNILVLSGSGSDSDGTIAGFQWTKVSGPSATLTNENNSTLSLSNLTAGSYIFRLTVTDNRSGTAFDDVAVTVNRPPIANAGLDKVITIPASTLALAGSGSDPDGSISSYQWSKISGPDVTLANSNTQTLALSALVTGTYVFRLTIIDNALASTSDDVTVVVNRPPTSNAGTDMLITLPVNTLILSGSGNDPDGSISAYQWVEITGQTPTMTNANTATLNLTNLAPGAYVFRLSVRDNWSVSAYDDVNVFVNQPPVVSAGADKMVTLPASSVTITSSTFDPDGTIVSYNWTQLSGNNTVLSNATTPALSVSNLPVGTYSFRLTVTDNLSSTSYDDVNVTVMANQVPIADAGVDQVITLPENALALLGRGVDMEGSLLTYQWIQLSGPVATLTNVNNAVLSLSNLTAGAYTLRLTVTDQASLSSYDDVNVFVNQPPAVNSGLDQIITLPTNTSIISGSANDPDGSIISYQWTQLSGNGATMANANTQTLSISNLIGGTYGFRLTATDNQSVSSFDDVTLIVNQPPAANAGTDRILVLPANSLTIAGVGTDSDGSIISYQWTQLSGNATTLTNATTATLSISDLSTGSYVFRLTVTDNLSITAYDDVAVTVNPNLPPLVNAGPDRIVTLPVTSLVISGNGSDPEGSVVSYQWTKISGGSATLVNANTATLGVSDLMAGSYLFRLTATDNLSNFSVDDVNIIVNRPPVANAGADRIIMLPTNTLTISGTATDPDGTVVSYQWTKIIGGTATLTNVTTSSISLSNLAAGTYLFRLTATDNLSGSSYDDVNVIVNQPPVANAGTDKIISPLLSTLNLTGSGTDADGSVIAYQWTKVSGPTVTLTNATSATVNLSNLLAGSYVFRLTVTDNLSASSSDEVNVIVNQPPVANAGTDKIISPLLSTLNLTGSGTDADGSVIAYQWTKVSGPTVTLTNATSATVNLSNLLAGSYVFRLTVTDNLSASSSDEVNVIVNQPPVANAGTDKIISPLLSTLNLTGSGTDADGSVIAYQWTKVSGPTATLTNATSATVNLSNLLSGSYVFRLTVTDNLSGSSFDDVNVIVNQPPVANAGTDKTINLPLSTLNLTGSGSDADGSVMAYQWAKVSGSTVTLTNATSATVNLSNLLAGSYVFRLTVTDNLSASSSDDIAVTVNPNQPPTAFAGNDIVMSLPKNTLTLTGSGSDIDGTISSYAWSLQSGPAVVMSGLTTSTLSIREMVAGSYVFQLTVTDNGGLRSTDEISVVVNENNLALNKPAVTSSTERPGLDGMFAVDGKAETRWSSQFSDRQWIYVDLGTTYALNRVKIIWETAYGSDYQIQTSSNAETWVTVKSISDNKELINDHSDIMGTGRFLRIYNTKRGTPYGYSIFELEAYGQRANIAPVVDAGEDQTIFLPTNNLTITGNGNDPDGVIAAYTWTQLSGPVATISGTSTASLSVTDLVSGTYSFRLTVNDNEGLSAIDDVSVFVATDANLALNKPVVTSSVERSGLDGMFAVDGKMRTRWSSQFNDRQWIYVDLEANYALNRVKITWEAAYGADYQIQISSDAATWLPLKTIIGNKELVNDHTDIVGTGRFLRISTTKRGVPYGYSIFELEAYGALSTEAPQLKISIYPVPSKDYLSISGAPVESSYVVVNSAGTAVLQGILPMNNTINVSELTAGFYFIYLTGSNQAMASKFLK